MGKIANGEVPDSKLPIRLEVDSDRDWGLEMSTVQEAEVLTAGALPVSLRLGMDPTDPETRALLLTTSVPLVTMEVAVLELVSGETVKLALALPLGVRVMEPSEFEVATVLFNVRRPVAIRLSNSL